MNQYVKLLNPTVVMHEGEIDYPEDDRSEVTIPFEQISIIRRFPSQRKFVFYVDHHTFNCFVSNPDQYEILSEYY